MSTKKVEGESVVWAGLPFEKSEGVGVSKVLELDQDPGELLCGLSDEFFKKIIVFW